MIEGALAVFVCMLSILKIYLKKNKHKSGI